MEALREFCDAFTEARIAQAERCPETLFTQPVEPCDGPAWARAFARMEQGRVTFEARAATACLADVRGSCGEFTCGGVLRGAVEPGGDCSVQEDCTGLGRCVVGDSCPGTCVGPIPEGGACPFDSPVVCEPGTYCSGGVCRGFVEEGGACNESIGTGDEPPLYCGGNLACTGGICAPVQGGTPETIREVGEGERCGMASRTNCAEGLICDLRTETCARPGSEGAACPMGGLLAANPCAGELICHDGVCTAPAEEGDPCDVVGLCPGFGLICFEGRCTTSPKVGEACDPGGLRCRPADYDPLGFTQVLTVCDEVSYTCVPLALGGEACSSSEECSYGFCAGGICQSEICAP